MKRPKIEETDRVPGSIFPTFLEFLWIVLVLFLVLIVVFILCTTVGT